MRCGLYGKLPAKRDFVAVAVPRAFLNVWEPWLQGGVSASRSELGGAWQAAYLSAPIWRFWLGREICGATIIGAFMPSVDGVGRYFPLTILASADAGSAIPPPEFDPQDEWFRAIEAILLSGLEESARYETLTETLDNAEAPSIRPPKVEVEGLTRVSADCAVMPAPPQALSQIFAATRAQNHEHAYATASFWWTLGGADFQPLAIVASRMPSPHLFTGMLTGRFEGLYV
jgi:type VI secretion system protein ImpM